MVRFHHAMYSVFMVLLGLGCTTILGGCAGEDVPNTYPVSGTVLYKGNPVEGAAVVFRSQGGDKTHVATGTTDAQGNFQLSTFGDKDGAVAGSHKVTISKMKSEGGEGKVLSMEEAAEQNNEPEQKVTSEIPIKYSAPAESGLTEKVTESGPNEFQFDLKD